MFLFVDDKELHLLIHIHELWYSDMFRARSLDPSRASLCKDSASGNCIPTYLSQALLPLKPNLGISFNNVKTNKFSICPVCISDNEDHSDWVYMHCCSMVAMVFQ